MKRTHKIIISILFILAIVATFWSATRAEEGVIEVIELDEGNELIEYSTNSNTQKLIKLNCPSWQLKKSCSWYRPSGEQTHTCYGEDEYCETYTLGAETVPECYKRNC